MQVFFPYFWGKETYGQCLCHTNTASLNFRPAKRQYGNYNIREHNHKMPAEWGTWRAVERKNA